MKSISFVLIIMLSSIFLLGQKLEFAIVSSTNLDKVTAKTGRYAGTFLNDNKINVLYFLSSEKEGVKLNNYSFSNALKFDSFADLFVTSNQAEEDFEWYIPQKKIEKIATGKERFLLAGAAFGSGMKIKFGSIQRHYMAGIFTTWDFVPEGKLKPKTDEIWRIIPSGYKTTSDYDGLATTDGFRDDLHKYGNPLLAPASATLLAAGVITEKISIKNPPPTNGNRVAVLAIDGENFAESKFNVYLLPYSALTMGSGLGEDDNLCVVFAPLNAPSSVKAHKKYLWKNRQNHFTIMRFSDDYQMVDSVSFISKLMWGHFEIYNGKGSTFVVGMGKDGFDGWARNAKMIGLKKLNAVQITKISGNNVMYSGYYNEDLMKEKLVVPDGDKKKYNFSMQNNKVQEIIPLPNGDDFVLGQSLEETYAIQLSPKGELKAFYKIPRIDINGSILYNYQLMLKDDIVYLVLNEQPKDFTNSTVVTKSTSTVSGAGIKTTYTNYTVKRLNEVFVQSQVLRINTDKLEMSNSLIMDGKEFYPMGSYPALFTEGAIYFTGREKGPKGKKIHVARIDI